MTGTLYGTAGEFLNEVKVGTRLIITPNEEGCGGIKFNSVQGIDPIKFYTSGIDPYGDGLVIGGGGGIVLGAGESPNTVYTNFLSENPGVEQTYITSDNSIYLLPACNTYENHPTFTFTTNTNVGNSALSASAGNNSIVTINTSSNNGVSTSGVNTIGQISLMDKNSVTASIFGSEANGNSGRIRTYISAHNQKTDGTYFGGYFCMDANKDGSISYSVTNPEAFRHAIEVDWFGRYSGLSANRNLTATAAKIPLRDFYGYGCTASSGGIKFNRTGAFMLWGSIYVSTGTTEKDIIHVQLRVNDTQIFDQLSRSTAVNPYMVIPVGPWIYYVSDANQVLSLYAYNQAQASGVVADSYGTNLMCYKLY